MFNFTATLQCEKCLTSFIRIDHYSFRHSGEYLKCTCGRCGCSWIIEMADNKTEKKHDYSENLNKGKQSNSGVDTFPL